MSSSSEVNNHEETSADLYNKYKKRFKIVDGSAYWQLFEIVLAEIVIVSFYVFNVWVYFNQIGAGIGVSIMLIMLTALAIYGLKLQMGLRLAAKKICEKGKIVNAKVLDFSVHVYGRSSYTTAKLQLENGQEEMHTFYCGKFGMLKYRKTGVNMIQSSVLSTNSKKHKSKRSNNPMPEFKRTIILSASKC